MRLPRLSDKLALATLCGILLLYQLVLTRILGVVLWYHYTFMVLALVMLGMSVPAIWFSMLKNPQRLLAPLLLMGGVSLSNSVVLIFNAVPPVLGDWALPVILAAAALPLLSLGGCVCLYLMRAPEEKFGQTYAYDLLGAAAGAALMFPLMTWVPAPKLIVILGVTALLIAFFNQERFRLETVVALLISVFPLFAYGVLEVRYSKYDETRLNVMYEKWTPMTRISVIDRIFWLPDPSLGFTWGAGEKMPRILRRQYWVEQDGSAGTPLTEFDGNLTGLDYLLYDVSSVGYLFSPLKRVAIIGAGGGRDILTALKAGAQNITAVEINAGMVDTVNRVFGHFSGYIYDHPAVQTVISEGRHFLARTEEKYDLIQISLIDSWAASVAGAFTLAENNLYTKEAYKEYFNKLTPEGVITTSRWTGTIALREVERLGVLVYKMLGEMDVRQPERHIALITARHIGTILVFKSPLTDVQVKILHEIASQRGFTVNYPSVSGAEQQPWASIFSEKVDKFVKASRRKGIDISASTDDRPFFFNISSVLNPSSDNHVNDHATHTLRLAVVIVSAMALILFFLPFAINAHLRQTSWSNLMSASLYFLSIGAGFMLMEIYVVQRLILFLGNPAIAASVALCFLLLGLALGALSEKPQREKHAYWLPVVLLFAGILLSLMTYALIGFHLVLKILLCALLIMPCAYLAGHFFPLGVRCFGQRHMPWFWAVNGAAGVLASVLSLPLAMIFGYRMVAILSLLAYGLSVVLLFRSMKNAQG